MSSQDYEEFIAVLNAHGVRYLVIGAHAVAFHARPRATKDLDILLEPTPENAHRALAALREFFGGADLGYTVEDLTDPQWIVQLGVAPVRIDLLSEIPGFPSFEAAWRNRVDAQFGAVQVHYLGLDDLLQVSGPLILRLCYATLRTSGKGPLMLSPSSSSPVPAALAQAGQATPRSGEVEARGRLLNLTSLHRRPVAVGNKLSLRIYLDDWRKF